MIKQLIKAHKFKKAGGNFGFIAQNIAAIYSSLKDTPFGASLTEPQLLYATGLCDAIVYLQLGQLSYSDISDAVLSALAGVVSLDFYSQRSYGFMEYVENKNLVNFTMQLEALIFRVDNNFGHRTIVDVVIEQKDLIASVINNSMNDIKKLSIYSNVQANVSVWASDPDFQNIVLAYDGI